MNLLLDNISKKNIDEIFYLGFKEVIGYELCGGREIKHNPPLNITKYTEESNL